MIQICASYQSAFFLSLGQTEQEGPEGKVCVQCSLVFSCLPAWSSTLFGGGVLLYDVALYLKNAVKEKYLFTYSIFLHPPLVDRGMDGCSILN